MKKIVYCILSLALLFFVSTPVFADYVLPYPSYMPGNKLYTISKILEKAEAFWYWGAIGQTKYHMALADKYLVEAKTLFEYKQYILAVAALRESDRYISKVPFDIAWGGQMGKDMSGFEALYKAEREVHRGVLSGLLTTLPAIFVWTPEKAPATTLHIADLLNTSLRLRSDHK